MPDSQRESLCKGSEVSHFKSVESDKGSLSSCASVEPYKHESSKFARTIGWKNDPATWSGVMNRNVRGYLIQIGPPTIRNRILSRNRSDTSVLVSLQDYSLPNGEIICHPFESNFFTSLTFSFIVMT